MRNAILFKSLILIFIFLTISTSAFGRYMIKGQVADAETGKPIEKEEYSKEKHAIFTTVSSSSRRDLGVFDQAIQSENDIVKEIFTPKTGESK